MVNPRRNPFGQGELFASPQSEHNQEAVEIFWDDVEHSTLPLKRRN